MKNNLIYFLVMVLWFSGCATNSPIDNIVPFPSAPATMITLSRTGCAAHQASVNQAIQSHDLDRLENLLAKLNRQSDCPISYLDGVKRSMAQIAAAQAGNLLQNAKIAEAKTWLKRAPTMVWSTQVVRGDIAAYDKQWRDAAQYFNQAIDLINDPQTTPDKPEQAKIDKVFQSALDAQLLAGEMIGPIQERQRTRPMTRSVGIKTGYPMPIQFMFGGNVLTPKGEKSAQKLADYIKLQRAAYVILTGHTDTKGSHRANDKISKQRSSAVKSYLQELGIRVKIDADGRGKREPLPLPRWKNLTQAEIDQRNRRVEFTTN